MPGGMKVASLHMEVDLRAQNLGVHVNDGCWKMVWKLAGGYLYPQVQLGKPMR